MTNWFKELMRDTAGAAVGMSIKDFIAGIGKKGHEEMGKYIEKLVRENPRADLLAALFEIDRDEMFQILDRLGESAREGKEDSDVRALASAIPRKKDGEMDIERAKRLYSEIAEMTPQRVKQVIELLHHDPVAQRVKHWLKHGKVFAEAIVEAVAYSAGVVTRWGEQINQRAEQKAQKMNQTRFGRLARRLIV